MHAHSLKPCEHLQMEKILRAMRALDDLATQLPEVPGCVFTNAFLNCAVERLLQERGFGATAGALNRLAGLIAAGIVPESRQGFPLNRVDA